MPLESISSGGPVILDSGAIIAWLENESGADLVAQVIEDHQDHLHMAVLNVCEVLYHFRRRLGASGITLALAQRLGGHVVTTDRKELDTPGPLAVCPIHFIR